MAVEQAGLNRNNGNRLSPVFVLGALAIWLAASVSNTLTFWQVPGFRSVTIALLAGAAAFGFVYLPIVLVASLIGRRLKRAASALAGMAVLLACFYISPLGPGAFRMDSWRLAYWRSHYLEQVRQSGPAPRFAVFPWGATGGVMSGMLLYWLVYDESGAIARPAAERSAAWRQRAAAELPFFASAGDCREREVRHVDGHFHVLIVAC
jgi:hypothetical protein